MDNRILNFDKRDPFNGIEKQGVFQIIKNPKTGGRIHIRVQQRTAKKKITTCEGLPLNLDYSKVLRALMKNYNCNGHVVDDDTLGKVLQLQGDHRNDIHYFLTVTGICSEDEIKIHGIE